MKHSTLLSLAFLVACETNTVATAGPCGSLSCGKAMFHDHAVLWEMTRDDCIEKARSPAEEDACVEAYVIVTGGVLAVDAGAPL